MTTSADWVLEVLICTGWGVACAAILVSAGVAVNLISCAGLGRWEEALLRAAVYVSGMLVFFSIAMALRWTLPRMAEVASIGLLVGLAAGLGLAAWVHRRHARRSPSR